LANQGRTPNAIEHFEAALAIYEQIDSPWAAGARERLTELKGGVLGSQNKGTRGKRGTSK
jgi:hypothetical protein